MDIYALWREISLDPVAMGYAGKTDAQVAALLNGKTRSTTRMSITGAELLDKTALAELKALDATSREAYWGLVGMGTLDITSANVKSIVGALFPAGSATRTALVALAAAPIMQSRAEALGLGVVEAVHVWQARQEYGGGQALVEVARSDEVEEETGEMMPLESSEPAPPMGGGLGGSLKRGSAGYASLEVGHDG